MRIFLILFIGIIIVSACENAISSNTVDDNKKVLGVEEDKYHNYLSEIDSDGTPKFNEDIENIHSIETTNYAIYPSRLIENGPNDFNEYVWWGTDVELKFPQIYFSREYSDYDGKLERQINEHLFALSLRKHPEDLIKRDTRDTIGYYSNYTVTKYNDDIFSIRYYGYGYVIGDYSIFCHGITINPKTGDVAEITDYISINEDLIKGIENGDIQYYADGLDKDIVIEWVSAFIKNYNNWDKNFFNDNFFINNDSISLIIDKPYGNGNFIVLELPDN